ncbi:Mitogen-activated protein kinase kinase kinase 2 [Perkinsus olseni]|uniref:Mitogen-activated protein kinase kinase kinase 2 n=1 Tax=Perkinsus olseni TaxID=32597 RepID=A0A7J6T613_PEROL|nr:Mitogen-activated protein kinase kinase kinase 2 [Perkinsus olseni]
MVRGTGQLLAIKMMDVDMDNDKDSALAKSLMAEVELLQGLDHPHIVKFYGVELRPHAVCIFLEMMPGGCLQTLLRQLGALDQETARHYTDQVMSGLTYLHSRNIVHRDLKCANVLLSLDGTVKVSDFGCSKRVKTLESSMGGENTILTHTITGSVPWMAPEVVGSAGHGRKADVWAVGCMVVEMLTAQPPWGKLDNIMAAVMRISTAAGGPELPQLDGAGEAVSEDCRDFVNQCTIRDPDARPNAGDLYERHKWLIAGREAAMMRRRSSQ